MLAELAVRDLGVIGELRLVLGPGMTAVTGETGAGKTLVVEAIELLVGGRADGTIVRHGADEAVVEGRFVIDDDEVVLRRVVPRQGRSRAYVDGRLATAAELGEWGRRLVDLHGQHDHQSLLSAPVQRAALDRFGGVDLEPLLLARKALAEIDAQLAELGGDPRERARELDLLRFQVDELDAAALDDPGEDAALELEEDRLGDAAAHQEALASALAAVDIDDGAGAGLARAVAALDDRRPFAAESTRLRGLAAELTDIAADLRAAGEQVEQDPERLDEVRARRRLLHELQRKYGEDLAEVMAYRDEVRGRVDALADRDRLAAELDERRAGALAGIAEAEHEVGAGPSRRRPRTGPGHPGPPGRAGHGQGRGRGVGGRRSGRRRDVPAGRQRRHPAPAAVTGGLGRRAGPLDAGAAARAVGGPAHPGVRRGRRRHRRHRGHGGGAVAGRPGR